MKFSLFRKYFLVSSIAITVALLFLLFIETLLQSDYIKSDRLRLLESNAVSISEAVKDSAETTEYLAILERTGNAYSSQEYTVFFVSVGGRTLLCTDTDSAHTSCVHEKHPVDKEIMQQIYQNDVYSEMGTLHGLYSTDHFTAGAQLLDSNNNYVGAVFISLNSDMYGFLIRKMVITLVISVGFALAVLYIVMLVLTKRLLKPLAQMSSAAKSMANGDFSAKISYATNDEIGELAQSFNAMCSSMEMLDAVRSSFIANVSHEFKTPMTIIGGYIDGILDGTIPKQDHEKYLRTVSYEVKRLNIMVNSMLQLSKVESGQEMHYVSADLSEIILHVFLSFENRITEKKIDVYGLDSLGIITVECDRDLIYNAIYNLVDNAVKFTPDGGYISVSKVELSNAVHLFLKNSGEGISKDELIHIFERFYKTDKSRSVDKSGTGLGLHIVKSVMHYHNGEVFARSKLGAYTEFEIDLPKKQS